MKTFQKPLTSKEEAEYLRLLQEGGGRQAKEAKSVLVERNLRLVAHVARKYQNTGEEMEDLISTGCIGLMKAIDTFDAGKGRLATYACRCIDNELLMLLRSKKKLSREFFYSILSDRIRKAMKSGSWTSLSRSPMILRKKWTFLMIFKSYINMWRNALHPEKRRS